MNRKNSPQSWGKVGGGWGESKKFTAISDRMWSCPSRMLVVFGFGSEGWNYYELGLVNVVLCPRIRVSEWEIVREWVTVKEFVIAKEWGIVNIVRLVFVVTRIRGPPCQPSSACQPSSGEFRGQGVSWPGSWTSRSEFLGPLRVCCYIYLTPPGRLHGVFLKTPENFRSPPE